MAVRTTSDVAKGRRARLELETRAGTYPTPASARAAAVSRGAGPGKPSRTMPSTTVTPVTTPSTDRREMEENEEFGFRTPSPKTPVRRARRTGSSSY